jgi:transcriptional regulator with XRE-family HTH domain
MGGRRRRSGKDASTEKPVIVKKDINIAASRIFAGLRVQQRFTQRDVSNRLGKRGSWTNLLENGHYAIKLQDFMDLCELYNREPADVITEIIKWRSVNDGA